MSHLVKFSSETIIDALRSRGATRLMCQTFHLQFHDGTGIVAWADSSLYETFAGPAMQKGDYWKIAIGRRIKLNEMDFDGSEFIEDLLEDAVFFPMRSSYNTRIHERWETVEESPGIWFTRPMNDLEEPVYGPRKDGVNSPVEDWRSDDEALWEERDLENEAQDAALENHSEVNMPICLDEYESSEGEGGDSDSEMDDDFDPAAPDGVFEASDEDEAIAVDAGDVAVDAGDIVVDATVIDVDDIKIEPPMDPYDSADSDFDSDEELSGDEIVLSGEGQHRWNEAGWSSISYARYDLGRF